MNVSRTNAMAIAILLALSVLVVWVTPEKTEITYKLENGNYVTYLGAASECELFRSASDGGHWTLETTDPLGTKHRVESVWCGAGWWSITAKKAEGE